MADGPTITVDDAALLAALDGIPDAVMAFVLPAERITADNIVREAQARFDRQTIAGTGATARGIYAVEAYDRTGYVVMTSDMLSQVERAGRRASANSRAGRKRAGAVYGQQPHVGLYLEYGTRRGRPGSHSSSPRPFFWPSVRLEESGHDRRIRQAIQDAIDAQGLGGA